MALTERTDAIARLLRHSTDARNADKYAFHRYEIGKLSLDNCIRLFRFNNRVPKDVTVDREAFRDWLAELNYRRSE